MDRPSRRTNELAEKRWRLSLLGSLGFLLLGLTGCTSLVGEYDAETRLVVLPTERNDFFGWSEITVAQDVSSVESAEIEFVVLEVEDPSQAPDLTFIEKVRGEAVTPAERTLVVEREGMPRGEPSAPLEIVHRGDLRPFFPDGRKIRIEWSGETNADYPFPPEGIGVRALVRVSVD